MGLEDPLEKEMETFSSIITWEIPWTEEPGGLQSMGSQELDMTYDSISTAILSKNQVLVSFFFFSCCFFGLHFMYFCSDHYYIFLLQTLGFVSSSSSFIYLFFASFRNKVL